MTFAVGDYQAIELLAAGASAQVWRGQWMATGEVVAMKVFPADQLAAVRREAALAAAVDHPHVVTVLDVVADDSRVALITEYAAGGDLADLLARHGRLSPGQTLTVLIPLAAALATAHERQIVHGDISAGNIVFDQSGRPLLADLGSARAAMESGRPVQATPCDAAPELARAGSPASATDMFSLGSVALACLTGRAAWPADDLRDVLIQAAAGQWPDLPDDAAPAPLVAAVRSLLEHDPELRPGAASLVLDLRSAGRPEPLDVIQGRRSSGFPNAAPGHEPEPGRLPSPRRHGRLDEDGPDSDDAASPRWRNPEVGRRDERDRPAGRRPDAPAAARALTRARADSLPGSRQGASPDGETGRSALLARIASTRGWRSRRTLRITAVSLGGVVVAVVAGLLGLWWAASGQAHPVAVQQLSPSSAPISAAGQVAGPGPATSGRAQSTTPRPSAQRTATPTGAGDRPAATKSAAATRAAPVATSPPGQTPTSARATLAAPPTGTAGPTSAVPPTDWTSTVQALDRARARALVSRDPALLDAVYTKDSVARSADSQTIRTLTADGLRVSGAEHQVQSVQPMTGSSPTVLVRDSLPSYQVLSSNGSVVGHTLKRSAAPRVIVLVHTAQGYRISEVRTP